MTREELKNLIASTGGCIHDVESVLKAISAAGLSVVPKQCTDDMAYWFNVENAAHDWLKPAIDAAIKSGDVLGGGE